MARDRRNGYCAGSRDRPCRAGSLDGRRNARGCGRGPKGRGGGGRGGRCRHRGSRGRHRGDRRRGRSHVGPCHGCTARASLQPNGGGAPRQPARRRRQRQRQHGAQKAHQAARAAADAACRDGGRLNMGLAHALVHAYSRKTPKPCGDALDLEVRSLPGRRGSLPFVHNKPQVTCATPQRKAYIHTCG